MQGFRHEKKRLAFLRLLKLREAETLLPNAKYLSTLARSLEWGSLASNGRALHYLF